MSDKSFSTGDLTMVLGGTIICAGVAMIYLPLAVILVGAGIAFAGQRLG